jgi:5-methylcytosine-specific restriction protein B
MFTWVPIHRETIHKIIQGPLSQEELLATLRAMNDAGLTVMSLDDQDAAGKSCPLSEIDPFSFFASFNRGVTWEHRRENWNFLKKRWNLQAPVPEDFDGIPLYRNERSWRFPYVANRPKDHIPLLWKLAAEAANRGPQQITPALFDQCLGLSQVGMSSLTIGLFWLNPQMFLPADNKTVAYGQVKGVAAPPPEDFATYLKWTEEITKKLGGNYPEISHKAHLFATQGQAGDPGDAAALHETPLATSRRYWLFAPGEDAEAWEELHQAGIMAIGWDGLGDLRAYKTRQDIQQKLQALYSEDSSQKHRSLACWQFAHDIQPGDVVFAKQGFSQLLGHGIVQPGDYFHDTSRPYFKNVRKVEWLSKGVWAIPEENKVAPKTLTEITENPDLISLLASLIGAQLPSPTDPVTPPLVSATATTYWWLNANPKIWDFRSDPVGAHQTYTSHNNKGNKRRIYEYFQAVKPGDLLLGYVTSPDKEIVALCRITKPLHTDPKEGEVFEFEKIEQLKKPVAWSDLQSVQSLTNCEPLLNNQGSLFHLTKAEFDTIRKMTEATETDDEPRAEITPFTEANALQDLFIDKPEQLSVILSRLRRKKALILQGPPGVGKTFVARRIAYALMGYKDDSRIHTVQFHPSYGYEDFVQGYRPTRAGSLERRDGVFYEFARSARNDPRGTWVFIIDEINRGNLAKIFGELLMLLEADKRGPKHSVSLTYSDTDEGFYLPENLFVIGTMNTADRSLAMVDYALRRRFAFATLGPALDTNAFATWFLQKGASKELLNKVRTGIGKLNSEITKERDLGEGFCIGHSFFCPADNEKPNDQWFSEIIDSEIKPLLKEYFESPDRVETLVKELLQ